jgi:hypothetical protein
MFDKMFMNIKQSPDDEGEEQPMMTTNNLFAASSPAMDRPTPSMNNSPPAGGQHMVYEMNQMKLNKLSSLQTYGGPGIASGGTDMPKDPSSSDRLKNAGKEVLGTFQASHQYTGMIP